ncbi:hypothetical protein WJ0W_002113 [Paenibacillus melissococcoides]|uniref:DUF4025 domain-containing protein n=1 Tax=Paenibacillus melissococcoides TaxID=2912268 RepID=A0ABM9FZY4_9BACL|nr:hypothetical protein WJ0W_002113 [Paenibacillus melissococcoides]
MNGYERRRAAGRFEGGVSQALQNDGDDEVTENVDAGKTAAQLVEDG